MKKLSLMLIIAFTSILQVSAQIKEEWIVGIWTVGDGSARVKVEKIGSKYYGKTIWLKEPNDKDGKPKVDVKNSDPALRSTPRLGLRIMKDFVYEKDGVFSSGNIYKPDEGKNYCGKITIKDQNTLSLRGYICGMKVLGKTQTWTRFTK